MIRFMRCMRRRDGATPVDFRRHWEDPRYDALIARMARVLEAERWSKSITLRLSITAQLMEEHGSLNPFDGVMELFWDRARDFDAMQASEEWQALDAELSAYEREFIDRKQSMFFVTEA